MAHQAYPTRQVHLVSTAGIRKNGSGDSADLLFGFNMPIVECENTYSALMSCVSASIPYTWKNVNSSNNTLTWHFPVTYIPTQYPTGYQDHFGTVSGTITIPEGQYSIVTLLEALNASLLKDIPKYEDASGNLLSTKPLIEYNKSTHLLTFTSIKKVFMTGPLWSFLGFATDPLSVYLPNNDFQYVYFFNNVTSKTQVNMIKTTSIYVECVNLLNESFDSRLNGQSGVIARIPVVGLPNNMLTWTNGFGTRTRLADKVIKYIHIRLLDDKREVLQIQGTWTMTLQFEVVLIEPLVPGRSLDRTTAPIQDPANVED
jgi:hypothetical protein